MKKSIHLNVANESMKDEHVLVKWALRRADAEVIRSGEEYVDVPALQSVWLSKEKMMDEMIDRTIIFHFGSLSMTDTVVREATKAAIEYAKSKGKLISFDPNLRPPLWSSMELAKEQISYGISKCDILKIADDEIRFMTGEDDIDKAIDLLQKDNNFKLLLVTLGKDGSIAVYKGKKVRVKGFVHAGGFK
ncbi:MAG: PfkB family carbohydrate kinase [Eubacteriales bacterium]|nr:PfkB family carbohydrate kinase [Eubacteriales bacterium]